MSPSHHRYHSDSSSTDSNYSEGSYYSARSTGTPATSYSPVSSPFSRRYRPETSTFTRVHEDVSPVTSFDSRASTETYASTIASEEFLDEQEEDYEVPDYRSQALEADATPATPSEFAELFPSSRSLCIAHDDSTSDGNMNLRVDTHVAGPHGRREAITLYHLRMHDLKHREFSFRRYCRDSGREVCHSSRKVIKPKAPARPTLQRSVSSALATLIGKSESSSTKPSSLKRHDSGYHSAPDDTLENESSPIKPKASKKGQEVSDVIKLEFSNYANVEINRQGSRDTRKYDFEYWGTKYSWRRCLHDSNSRSSVSFQLFNVRTNRVVAFIDPDNLTPQEAYEEVSKHGWVHPCHMRIIDSTIIEGSSDVADVVVATGLIALVDDSIKRHFHQKSSLNIAVPLSKTNPLRLEYIGPKKLIDEVFNRNKSHHHSSSKSQQQHSRQKHQRHIYGHE